MKRIILLPIILCLLVINHKVNAQVPTSDKSIKLGTFDIPSGTPIPTIPPEQPTNIPQATNPPINNPPPINVPPIGLITGGPVNPSDPVYCIDDEDPDSCDDNTAFHVPKGTGGVPGSCGTVVEQGHKIVNSLPHFDKGIRDSVNPSITNCNYSTGTYSSGYISTFLVIDAYNLAGHKELSKSNPSHVRGSDLLAWWNSPEAAAAGYTYIPYSASAIQNHAAGTQNLTGCTVFLNLSSGVHVGIFNVLEVTSSANGQGVLSILQSGVRFYIDRFLVDNWNILNTPQHQTQLSSVSGFGCHI